MNDTHGRQTSEGNHASEDTMVCIGAVCVLADQTDDKNEVVIIPAPFQFRLVATQQVVNRLGEEAIKEIGFTFIASSEWAAKVVAMREGDMALLPPQRGCSCVVRRDADEAVLGILDGL